MPNKVYRIGEAAKILGIKTSTLRFWEEEFSQVRPKRTEKGQRYYSENDMLLLQNIRSLLYDEGMTIAGVQKTFKKNSDSANSPNNITNSLQNVVQSNSLEKTENYANVPVQQTFLSELTVESSDNPLVNPSAKSLEKPLKENSFLSFATQNISPTFFPNSAHADNMPTAKILTGSFPDCEKCEENSYLSAKMAELQTDLNLSKEKNALLEQEKTHLIQEKQDLNNIISAHNEELESILADEKNQHELIQKELEEENEKLRDKNLAFQQEFERKEQSLHDKIVALEVDLEEKEKNDNQEKLALNEKIASIEAQALEEKNAYKAQITHLTKKILENQGSLKRLENQTIQENNSYKKQTEELFSIKEDLEDLLKLLPSN